MACAKTNQDEKVVKVWEKTKKEEQRIELVEIEDRPVQIYDALVCQGLSEQLCSKCEDLGGKQINILNIEEDTWRQKKSSYLVGQR